MRALLLDRILIFPYPDGQVCVCKSGGSYAGRFVKSACFMNDSYGGVVFVARNDEKVRSKFAQNGLSCKT